MVLRSHAPRLWLAAILALTVWTLSNSLFLSPLPPVGTVPFDYSSKSSGHHYWKHLENQSPIPRKPSELQSVQTECVFFYQLGVMVAVPAKKLKTQIKHLFEAEKFSNCVQEIYVVQERRRGAAEVHQEMSGKVSETSRAWREFHSETCFLTRSASSKTFWISRSFHS